LLADLGPAEEVRPARSEDHAGIQKNAVEEDGEPDQRGKHRVASQLVEGAMKPGPLQAAPRLILADEQAEDLDLIARLLPRIAAKLVDGPKELGVLRVGANEPKSG
jgi:hypothetical protein